jgi:transcriptional regulator with PAS, ATPase and Fis domain
MGRLDVRVKTRLEATVIYISRQDQREESVSIRELSLSGALVFGMTTELHELFTVKPVLPGVGELELLGKIVRRSRGGTAIRLFYSDKNTMEALWDYIKKNLEVGDSCPYCGHPENPGEGCCDKCNLYLNFRNENYLERHIENTFAQRLNIRLSRLNLEHIQKIIQFVDSRFLKIQHRPPDREFVGSCPAMLSVFSMIRKVAPTEMSVLILGESGTGKELTAKAIHEMSVRKEGPFVAVNCAAIPETLLEAELFGYEKGAFTGAYTTKKGKFESADGGSLFLDEIGDLTPNLQAKLLRFLEDRLIERVGSSSSKKIDVRIIAATNSDLRKSMEEGRFRPDLYYRLNSFTINLPPLRERGEDKVVLAGHFLKKSTDNGNGAKEFSDETLEAIRLHSWPGNVRELENKVRRGVLMSTGAMIEPDAMELDERNILIRLPAFKSGEQRSQKEIVSEVLEQNDYVIARAARELKISRPSMYALMKKFGISGRSR